MQPAARKLLHGDKIAVRRLALSITLAEWAIRARAGQNRPPDKERESNVESLYRSGDPGIR
jgi:hypothetical protein